MKTVRRATLIEMFWQFIVCAGTCILATLGAVMLANGAHFNQPFFASVGGLVLIVALPIFIVGVIKFGES